MSKVDFIPNHQKNQCWACEGKGCDKCNNTGIFVEESYYLIYTDKKGLKQGFIVDGLK